MKRNKNRNPQMSTTQKITINKIMEENQMIKAIINMQMFIYQKSGIF
jgi:hypothetical protein